MHIVRKLLVLLLAAAVPATASAEKVQRPRYEIDLSKPYSSDSVPAYTGDHAPVYEHIDTHLSGHLANLQRWLRQPSVSAQNLGIREMAELVRGDLQSLGFAEAELVETDGHPGVWGYYDAGADVTLMVYMMYDVQPVNPEDWRSPPFEAEVVSTLQGEAVMARGATNQKGPERAFLNALESIIAVTGTLPVNIMLTAEGEEELGSPNYPAIIDRYEDRLKTADGVIFPMSGQGPSGHTTINLGVKGIVYWELEARGGAWGGPARAEIHGSFKAITDSPVLRLMQAINSLVSEDGNTILVPGYYDDVRPPTEEEQSLIAGYMAQQNTDQFKALMGVERWLDDLSGVDVFHELIYSPTINVDGIWAGYTEEGVKTILPHVATAKMDSRLPLGIDSNEALAKIRQHLDNQGFSDLKMTIKSNYPAAQTSVDTSLVRATISVYKKYGATPTVNPRIAGSAPFYQFTERLKLPMLPVGLGFGQGAHAPNETYLVRPNGRIASLADIEKSYVDLLYAFAREVRAE